MPSVARAAPRPRVQALILMLNGVAPSESAKLVPLQTKIDPLKCMGTWYVQRQIPALSFLEAGASNGMERYEFDAELQRFSVEYTFNRRGAEDKTTTIRQVGRFVSELGTQWAVAPKIGKVALPVNLPFVIVDVDPSSHMLCSGGLDSWMYLMTRQTQPSDMLIQTCLAKAAAAGFNMGKVLVVQQTKR